MTKRPQTKSAKAKKIVIDVGSPSFIYGLSATAVFVLNFILKDAVEADFGPNRSLAINIHMLYIVISTVIFVYFHLRVNFKGIIENGKRPIAIKQASIVSCVINFVTWIVIYLLFFSPLLPPATTTPNGEEVLGWAILFGILPLGLIYTIATIIYLFMPIFEAAALSRKYHNISSPNNLKK